MTHSAIFGGCFHCEERTHWADNCPLLIPPEDKSEHDARFARVMERFWNGDISPHGKRRVIEKENQLWAQVQKKMKTGAT